MPNAESVGILGLTQNRHVNYCHDVTCEIGGSPSPTADPSRKIHVDIHLDIPDIKDIHIDIPDTKDIHAGIPDTKDIHMDILGVRDIRVDIHMDIHIDFGRLDDTRRQAERSDSGARHKAPNLT